MRGDGRTGRFDIAAFAAALPETADTLVADADLTDRDAASARAFRVYKPTPPRSHRTGDASLCRAAGRGTFRMREAADEAALGPGRLPFFERGAVQTIPAEPPVFLSVDTPRRGPTDLVFVDPEDGGPAIVMARHAKAGEP